MLRSPGGGMAYTNDLRSFAARHVGSTPTPGTTQQYLAVRIKTAKEPGEKHRLEPYFVEAEKKNFHKEF
jgi:hypothetical protein